jgi:hypothetical protein
MNAAYQTKLDRFLAARRVAVAGYSFQPDPGTPANAIYDKLKANGREVFAVNPHAPADPPVPAFASVAEIPGGVEAVMICTPPQATMEVLEACAAQGIRHAWIHRSVNSGSYVPEAEPYAKEHGIELITFGCPMMFVTPDIAHRCMRWVFKVQGKFKG